MRKQIAAANWKMNLEYDEAGTLLDSLLHEDIQLAAHQQAIFAVPFPYLEMASKRIGTKDKFAVAAQNCHQKESGAYTGEVSAPMLRSMGTRYCIIGHSERREFNKETNELLEEKTAICLDNDITPIFCCGEPLETREQNTQNDFVAVQLKESLFRFPAELIKTIIIAYEPIWAIGTGRTASTEQAQEMHRHLRSVISMQYGDDIASVIPILYGGSVKPSNARELFSCADVDGGLVGGASLVAADFAGILRALK